ncbi:uncharacterized protein fend [Macrobrachium rosenbergii]|uniref:uncharacterized protein fend n=1 Tax=Macrobrachium rosenbergii TaxID=79674 RepID=UPI0034D72246
MMEATRHLFWTLSVVVVGTSCFAMDIQSALKMAQCRAHCLDKFENDISRQDDASCRHSPNCLTCWDNCEMLASNYPIWSITCNQKDICSEGCEAACAFHSQHPESVVPLSQHNSRLTLVFSGWAAQWTLTWGRDAPSEHIVFALFTKTPGKSWNLRLQTADFGAFLDDLPSGSDMKLVAVAESGVLSVIITPYAPPSYPKSIAKPSLEVSHAQNSAERPENNGIENSEEMWPLLYETEVEDSGLVAARVWWAPQNPRGVDYLVTWEVESGGLKGHLYTDLPEVDLTLWPETIYHVQVELVTGPLGEPFRSAQLTLDTHNITLAAQASQNEINPKLPLVHQFTTPVQLEIILGVGAGVVAALLVVVVLVWRRRRASPDYENTANGASTGKWAALNRTISDLTLDESLVVKNHKAPMEEKSLSSSPVRPTPIGSYHAPVYTLTPPVGFSSAASSSSSSASYYSTPSLLTLARPSHAQVNLYSAVPALPNPRVAQVSNI